MSRQCEAIATTRSTMARFDRSYRCPHPAKYRVQSASAGVVVYEFCGRHVRPFLMDSDSVWKPWIVTSLAALREGDET